MKEVVIYHKYYFTYGTYGQSFVGGWTEIEAPDVHVASTLFRTFHPSKTEGTLNCSSVYTEEEFRRTKMYRVGNFGAWCHERITVTRTLYGTGEDI